MDREFLATGKTVEEAIEAAYKKAGVDREYVTVELLERPKKKFFGLKTEPAKAKAVIDEAYWNKMFAAPKAEKREKPEKKEAPKAKKEVKENKPVKAEQPKPAEQPKQEKPKKEKPQQPKQEKKQPVEQKPVETPAPASAAKEETKVIPADVLDVKGGEAAEYIKSVLVALGYPDADVTYAQKDGMIVLQLSGEDMGAVVGRRGDNLDAMQYLASLVANRSEGSYIRVVLDIDDYRSKREASLRAYARKMANNAVRQGRSITLEPMNPYERRIVHSTVQTVGGATSKSIGSEPNRKVIISPVEGAKPRYEKSGDRPEKGERRGRNDRRNGRGGKNGERRESQKVIVPPSNDPPKNDVSGISLYGRIEL